MAKHKEKYCSRCGRVLIFSYYRKPGSSYKLCKKCYREKERERLQKTIELKLENRRLRKERSLLKKERKQRIIAERIAHTGMRQSYLAMVIKILLGILFVLFAISSLLDKEYLSMQISLILGAAFLAWGILPFALREKS